MDYKEKEGGSEYINDYSSYAQTLDELKNSSNNQVIHLITMQNHMPYEDGIFDKTDFELLSDDLSEKKKSEISKNSNSITSLDNLKWEKIIQ